MAESTLLPPEERLKKSVGAIHSSGKLTLVQRKLANILLYAAYDKLLSERTHTLPVKILCIMLGWDESNRIDYLKEALAALQETRLEFNLKEDGHEVWESMTMLSYANIKNGICTWRYDEALAEKLFDPAMFSMINLQVQKRIDSAYALNLYENTLRYKDTNTGSTGRWELGFFREIIGATASYCDDFRLLNRKVIKPAIEKINLVSDIMVSVDYLKNGRSVTALKFHVRDKTEAEKKEQQANLPGMSFPESIDNYASIRNTDAFKALSKHGIPERLSLAWINERGEEAILDLVAYTEQKDIHNLIRTNTRSYLTQLVKNGAKTGLSDYEKNKRQKQQIEKTNITLKHQKTKLEILKTEYEAALIKNARITLTTNQRKMHAEKWLSTQEDINRTWVYDANKGRFKDPIANIQFEQVYLASILAQPFSENDFLTWLNTEKNITLDSL